MRKYKFEIWERKSTYVEIEAESEDEAVEKFCGEDNDWAERYEDELINAEWYESDWFLIGEVEDGK